MIKIRELALKITVWLKKPKAIVISHKDVDGIASASILIRYLSYKLKEKNFKVIFAGPATLSRVLDSLKVNGTRIFICDISPNVNKEEKILKAILKLKSKENAIEWIDHHKWRESFKNKISNHISKLIVERTSSTAKLVFREYMPDDEISFKIMRYGDDADTLSDNFNETLAYRFLLCEKPKWRKYLLNLFVRGVFWDEEVEKIYRRHLRKVNSLIEKITSKCIVMETCSGRKFALINLRGIKYPKSWIAGRVASKLELDFTVTIRKINAVSLYSRKNLEVNLLPIAMHYGGGGHPYACGFRLKLSIKSCILSLILGRGYVPREIWKVIEKIKNEI